VTLNVTLSPVVDITGWALTFTIKLDPGDAGTVLVTKTVGSGITITDGPNGKADVVIAEADGEKLLADHEYDYDLWRTDSGNKTPLTFGRIKLRERVGSV
jgi:hypothetical protein